MVRKPIRPKRSICDLRSGYSEFSQHGLLITKTDEISINGLTILNPKSHGLALIQVSCLNINDLNLEAGNRNLAGVGLMIISSPQFQSCTGEQKPMIANGVIKKFGGGAVQINGANFELSTGFFMEGNGSRKEPALQVEMAYREAFGRAPLQREDISYWIGLMQSGSSYLDIVNALRNYAISSAEITNWIINQAYSNAAGRPSLAFENDSWRGQFVSGALYYKSLYNLLKTIFIGELAIREDVVEKSYLEIFGRSPTMDEKNFWQQHLMANNLGYEDLVVLLRENANYHPWWYVDILKRAYSSTIHRTPTESEISYWVPRMTKGETSAGQLIRSLE